VCANPPLLDWRASAGKKTRRAGRPRKTLSVHGRGCASALLAANRLGSAAARSFGTAQTVQGLRVKGAAGRALRREPPPRLAKTALKHYVKVLQKHGGDAARRVTDNAAVVGQEPGALTSEEKTALLQRYLPEEQEALKTLRKHGHKWLWRWIKRRDWKRFAACLEELRDRQVPFDEVTYTLSIFGILLNPRRDDALARQVLAEMAEEGKFHPSWLRFYEGFIDSYFELKEVDAAPNPWNLRKTAKTFWEVSVNFKRMRVKDLRGRLALAAGDMRRQQALGAHALLEQRYMARPVKSGKEEQDDEEPFEMSDFEEAPVVRMPAKRYPRTLRGAHKGSGVPRQRAFRWKQ